MKTKGKYRFRSLLGLCVFKAVFELRKINGSFFFANSVPKFLVQMQSKNVMGYYGISFTKTLAGPDWIG